MTINCKITKPYAHKICQYDLKGHFIKEWDSYLDITKATGFAQPSISQCCYGKISQAYGYRWSFK